MATPPKYALGIALSLLAATSSFAAEPVLTRPGRLPIIVSSPQYGYPFMGGRATTAHESINRGRGHLIRSIGERHLLDARAQRNREEAIDRRLDNVLKADHLRLQRRRMGEAKRQEELAELHSRRQKQMALNRADQMLKSGLAEPSAYETPAEARLRIAKSLLAEGNHAAAIDAVPEARSLLAGSGQAAGVPQ